MTAYGEAHIVRQRKADIADNAAKPAVLYQKIQQVAQHGGAEHRQHQDGKRQQKALLLHRRRDQEQQKKLRAEGGDCRGRNKKTPLTRAAIEITVDSFGRKDAKQVGCKDDEQAQRGHARKAQKCNAQHQLDRTENDGSAAGTQPALPSDHH